MVFRSKIDLWLLLVLAAAAMVPLLQVVAALRNGGNWLPHLVVFGILGGLFSWMLLSTKYTVNCIFQPIVDGVSS